MFFAVPLRGGAIFHLSDYLLSPAADPARALFLSPGCPGGAAPFCHKFAKRQYDFFSKKGIIIL
jgi:hypothetical protein